MAKTEQDFVKVKTDKETGLETASAPMPKKHMISEDLHTDDPKGRPAAFCTCGWKYFHLRGKVRGVAARKHESKTGHKISKGR